MDFGEHLEGYLKRKEGVKTKNTLRMEEWKHRQFWRFLEALKFQGDELAVTRKELQAYLEFQQKKGVAVNAIRSYLGCLRPFYDDAVRQDHLLRSPFLGFQMPKPKREPCKVLSVQQMKKLLESPDLSTTVGLRDRAMMELMYSCGLRRSEVCSLKADDLGDEFRSLRVMGKGEKEAVLPVGKIAAHFLGFYVDEVLPKLNRKKLPFLFLSIFNRNPLHDYQVYRTIRDHARQAGIAQNISPHVVRYSIATHFDEAGVDVRYIQEFLRHESIDTTSRYINLGFHRLQSVHRQTHPNT